MKQRTVFLGFFLLACLLSGHLFSQESITLTLDEANKPEFINLKVKANGPWTIEGASEDTSSKNRYTPTSSTITIKGEITSLDCSGNKIISLDLSKTKSLTMLFCDKNEIAELDISTLSGLTKLWCYQNKIKSLSLLNHAKLKELKCYSNQLKSLDISGASRLITLLCYNNQLEQLDITKNKNLMSLECSENKLRTILFSEHPLLNNIYCFDNQLSSLDLSGLPSLSILDCRKNLFSEIDLSKSTSIELLDCSHNNLSKLSLPASLPLKSLTCNNTNIEELELSPFTELWSLECDSNRIASLNLSSNLLLKELLCKGNQLKSIDCSSHKVLEYVDVSDNQIESLLFSPEAKSLNKVFCHQNNLNKEGVTKMIESLPARTKRDGAEIVLVNRLASMEGNFIDNSILESLKSKGWKTLDHNGGTPVEIEKIDEPFIQFHTSLTVGSPITILAMNADFSLPEIEGVTKDSQGNLLVADQNIQIKGDVMSLIASDIKMTSLDVSHAPNLSSLIAAYNELSEIDLSHNSKLETVLLPNNRLTNVIWGTHPSLKELYIYDNQLNSIDVSSLVGLEVLSVSGNQLKTIELDKNPLLKELFCARIGLQNLDISANKDLELLDISSNAFASLSIEGLSKLKKVYLYQNKFSLNAMQTVMDALPQRVAKDKALVMVIDSESKEEQNQFSDDFLKIIQPKNWQAFDFKGGVNEGNGILLDCEDIIGSEEVSFGITPGRIVFFNVTQGSTIRLMTPSGEVLNTIQTSTNLDASIDTENLPRGVYLLQIGPKCHRIIL